MIDPGTSGEQTLPLTIRAVFIINPENKLMLSLNYPACVGRNMDEIVRCVKALQLSYQKSIATPANWPYNHADIPDDKGGRTTEYKGSEMAQQLCDGNIDAMIYTVGHPAAAIQEATTTCDVELVDVSANRNCVCHQVRVVTSARVRIRMPKPRSPLAAAAQSDRACWHTAEGAHSS